ncbi:alpha/beta fold hydrolase [Limosilactobacillus ingluviei]|uniref:alpha/beta fold hydrolase n=1 Tax=Limosilactobacillus ingluviei TaxID=148604 RepID=UPI0002E1DF81|nr:alpha/beta hydrolase [Limosilactobacillus ingluviei]
MKQRLVITILLGALAGLLVSFWPVQAAQSSTTTYFMHGYGSSARAEHQMTTYLTAHGASNTIVRVNVDRKGHAVLVGHVAKNAHHPLVEVNFADSRNTDFHQDGRWLKAAIEVGQRATKTKQINLIGHSMGNLTTLAYLNDYRQQADLPPVRHLVMLAGGLFPGMKAELTSELTKNLPAHLTVLNVYSTADQRVPNAASRRLRPLFKSRAASYREVKLTGLSHSQLHESRRVDRLLLHFLFD